MMQAARGAGRVHPQDDIGARHANQAHVVAEYLFPSPLLERLFDAERVAEIDRAGEVLLARIETVHRLELSRSQHRERIVQLGPDFVLPAIAACRSGEHGAHALPAIQVDMQGVVLIVRMRRCLHKHAGGGELPQYEAQSNSSVLEIDRTYAQLRARLVITGAEHGERESDCQDETCTHGVHKLNSR